MRRGLIVLACAALVWAPASSSQARREPGVLVVALPDAEARALTRSLGAAAVGLGVYPTSRAFEDFARAIGEVEPRGDPSPSALAQEIRRRGLRVGWSARGAAHTDPATRALLDVFGSRVSPRELRDYDVAAFASTRARAVRPLLRGRAAVIVIGVRPRLPVTVAMSARRWGRLAGGLSRRPMLVTPYDLASTILARVDAPTDGLTGRQLRAEPDEAVGRAPFAAVDALAARLERDDSFGPGLSKATAGFGIAAVVLASVALVLGRHGWAARGVQAAALVPLGYLLGLFVPSADWQTRALPLAALFLIGLAVPGGSARRAGIVLLATASAVGLLAVAAAVLPGTEPALSLWGNPLSSWRLFGLRNHLAAFVGGGFLVGGILLGLEAGAFALGGLVALAVVGAPVLGANYIGVLTIGIGVGLALVALQTGRLRVAHVVPAAVFAVAATAAALWADAGSPISHGGRAVQDVRSGGLAAVGDLLARRARLNANEIAEIGWAGPVGFAALCFALVAMLLWAFVDKRAPLQLRAAVASGATAAIAAVVLEDSGFLTGGILGLYPWIAGAGILADAQAAHAPDEESPPAWA